MSKKICQESNKSWPVREKKAKYSCKSCGAEAVKEKHLCKPKKL